MNIHYVKESSKYYDDTMKRKNQIKSYCARLVILIIAFVNIYKIFRSITPFKQMLITNQYVP